MATDKAESSTDNTSVSVISSNYEILELARLKASESVVNIDQFYLEIKNEIDIYSDIDSSPNDNNPEASSINDTKHEPITTNAQNENQPTLFSTELNPNQTSSDDPDSSVPKLWTDKNLHTLPSLTQIVDTRASDRYSLAMVALKSGQWTDAICHFSRCIHLKPLEPSYYANRAEIHIQLVDFQSAIVNYKRACMLDPANDDFLQRLAFLLVFQSQLLFDQGQYSRALDSLGRAIEIAPTNSSYQMRAIAVLAAMHRHNECLLLVNKQIAINDSNADFFVLRAKLHSNFRNFSLSYYDLVDALSRDPNHSEARKVLNEMAERAANLDEQSTRLALANRLKDAASRISLAIELNPLIGQYHVKRGAFHRRLGDYTAAIDDFIIAMDKVDHNEQHETHRYAERQLVLTFNDFAVDCCERGCFDEAIDLLDKAIQREKCEPRFYVNRGDCFFHLRQWDFALADYAQARSLSVEFNHATTVRRALVHFSIGQQRFNDGLFVESDSELTEAIRVNPFPATFWNLRARARYSMNDLDGSSRDVICGILLAGLDKGMESICGRLFPGMNSVAIVEGRLGKLAKKELDRLVRETEEAVKEKKPAEKESVRGETGGERCEVRSCIAEDRMMAECMRQYHEVERQVRNCSTDKAFMKKSGKGVLTLPDVEVPVNCGTKVARVGGSTSGKKFFVDDQGAIVRAVKQKGWRKFKGGIEMK